MSKVSKWEDQEEVLDEGDSDEIVETLLGGNEENADSNEENTDSNEENTDSNEEN